MTPNQKNILVNCLSLLEQKGRAGKKDLMALRDTVQRWY